MKFRRSVLLLAVALLLTGVQQRAYADPPKLAAILLGDVDTYTPISTVTEGPFTLRVPASYRNRFESVNRFPMDRYGTRIEQNFEWLPEVRVGAQLESSFEKFPVHLFAEYEQDLTTGTAVGAPNQAGYHLPNGIELDAQLRKGYLRADLGKYFVMAGGYMMSHWGMGLLANDGAHGWLPGSARFSDPRYGDRVLRGYVGTQPLTDYGLVLRVAYDDVVDDDVLLEHDTATQWIFSARAGSEQKTAAGIYVVYRQQDSSVRRGFDVWAIDFTASHVLSVSDIGILTLATENVIVTGDTRLAPTPDLPRKDILQFAHTLDLRLDCGGYGGVLSFLYASGDQNFEDKDQNAFKADPNFEFGLLLFRQVLAAQSGRAPIIGGDPGLTGRPVPDLDRIATSGSPTNTIAFFPRGWIRTQDGLEAYGGPLIALSEVNEADPFNTRLAGGAPRNFLGGNPSNFYGVELDAGVRYRTMLFGTELTTGIEGGVLFPGNAFLQLDGTRMGEVLGVRAMVDYRL